MNATSAATLPLTPLGRRGELNITRLVFGGALVVGHKCTLERVKVPNHGAWAATRAAGAVSDGPGHYDVAGAHPL